MAQLRIGNLELGSGRPRIIVPLTSSSIEALAEESAALASVPADMVEWRADLLDASLDGAGMPDASVLDEAFAVLSRNLGGRPLLATFRTAAEGGREISAEAYAAMVGQLCRGAALVDIEAFHSSGKAAELVAYARSRGVASVASSHDFHATPAKEEIVRRLRIMQDDLDADILKIAVMPRSMRDVLTLLDATEEMRTLYARRPLITMSMGPLGVVSRVAGQAFGSCATFGAAGRCSAPGQMDVYALEACLSALDAGMSEPRI